MTILVDSIEIEQWRIQMSGHPGVLAALNTIEDCEGDLEDAAITLAIQAGQEPNTSDRWLEGLAKRWRATVCQPELKTLLQAGLTSESLVALKASTELSERLVTTLAIYLIKTGMDNFCQPFEENFTLNP